MSEPRDPLTPEEREIARRLARLGAPAEPSSTLDAGILSAARTAAKPASGSSAALRPRLRRRWPVGLGLAASLALAVGVAWQLRPLPDAGVEYSEAPAPSPKRDVSPAAGAGMADSPAGEAQRHEQAASNDEAMTPPAPADTTARRQAAPIPGDTRESATPTAADPESAPVVFDAPAPTAFPAAPSPPAPVVSPAPQPDLSVLSSGAPAPSAARDASRERKANAARADAETRARAEALDRIEVTGSRIREDDADAYRDQPFDEDPPASADSPEVRKAWLTRIRELVAAGELEAARASLREFRRRYPLTPLPDDLRPLIE
ncbi:MAG: hypothetical protein ACR2J7_05575 [Luteimonas sp.]